MLSQERSIGISPAAGLFLIVETVVVAFGLQAIGSARPPPAMPVIVLIGANGQTK
jgi:hypothetical protein